MCTVLLPPGGYPIAVKYIISYFLSDSKTSTVTEAMGVLPEDLNVFEIGDNTACPFRSEPCSNHAMPTAALYSAGELS